MFEVELVHWWYQSLYKLVIESITQKFSNKNISILDAGCGTGGLMYTLKKTGFNKITGFDLSEDAVKICRDRGLNVYRNSLQNIEEKNDVESIDVVISNDNLYFLDKEEQRLYIKSCSKIIKSEGLLIMNLPAFDVFRGIHDLSVGISKRFSRKNIDELFSDNNFEVSIVYWPFILSPLIGLVRMVQRFKLNQNKQISIKSDIDLPPYFINKFLGKICQLERSIPIGKPFGSSLLVVAKKI